MTWARMMRSRAQSTANGGPISSMPWVRHSPGSWAGMAFAFVVSLKKASILPAGMKAIRSLPGEEPTYAQTCGILLGANSESPGWRVNRSSPISMTNSLFQRREEANRCAALHRVLQEVTKVAEGRWIGRGDLSDVYHDESCSGPRNQLTGESRHHRRTLRRPHMSEAQVARCVRHRLLWNRSPNRPRPRR